MRYLVVIIACIMSLALVGPAGAVRATELGGCMDSPMAMYNGSASAADCDTGKCDMGKNKARGCNHAACCVYPLVAVADVTDFSAPPKPRTAAVAAVVKHLTSSGGETLLDPPRA